MAKPAAMRVTENHTELDVSKLHLRLVAKKGMIGKPTQPVNRTRDKFETYDDVEDLWDNVPV